MRCDSVGEVQGERKRIKALDLQFVRSQAPEIQVVRVEDVEPKPECSWRAGLNKCPPNLEAKMIAQLHKELSAHELDLQTVEGKMMLVCRKPLREGEIVFQLTGFTFDSIDKLRNFLNNDHRSQPRFNECNDSH